WYRVCVPFLSLLQLPPVALSANFPSSSSTETSPSPPSSSCPPPRPPPCLPLP
ncbi:Hypothetical predicted protein, partial [Marmota monax]